ncbi:hypothetical protein DYB32_004393 [Aphanomyces invadans]|uniref:C2 domain-containing protein n=1 Tax=Aphanomyces invadans TaxID=157072 RepID=A0A418AXK7_9STRA|nr:hypothetical protein DYB32_004393 [Aphanomyces invadans]
MDRQQQVRIHVKRVVDIPPDMGILGSCSCDPYVVMELRGVHKTPRPYVTKVVPFTVNPTWTGEVYVVTMSETERERCILRVSVFDHNDVLPDELVGEAHIHLGDIPIGIHLPQCTTHTFPVITSASRRRRRPSPVHSAHIELAFDIITLSSKDKDATIQLEVWEHQRFSIVRREWSKEYLDLPPADPYPWTKCSDDHTQDPTTAIGGFHMADTTAPIPPGFVSHVGWVYDIRLGDENGWQYARSFKGPWHRRDSATMHVRKRLWINSCTKAPKVDADKGLQQADSS